MKFRTEIEILPYDRQLSYDDRLLALGSCFATEIGRRMAESKFRIAVNPSGVLFNPLSIVRTLRRYRDGRPVAKEELQHADGRWFHYDFHGSLAGDTADEALTRIDAAVAEGARALHEASAVLLTLGTAWVYERTDTGDVVANCHRQPAERFRRRRLSVEEVVSAIESVLPDESSGKRILLTVSPVRHLGDGLAGNAVSKAVLRLADEELSERHAQVAYFPAYEILCDDLGTFLRGAAHARRTGAAAPHRRDNGRCTAPAAAPCVGGLPRLLPPPAGSHRTAAGSGFHRRNGIFSQPNRN